MVIAGGGFKSVVNRTMLPMVKQDVSGMMEKRFGYKM
jgi:hypothetical protein